MPLGIFSKDSGPKPQPLTGEEKKKKEKVAGGGTSNNSSEIKDAKGSTVKLWKKTYTVERKLAEGGFAIVYLVADKHNRNYALKRQLIRDDPRQVDACRTESQIVKNLNGHKNIVAYIDHQLTVNKAGVFDYMLLTIYYPENVLQLMNSRLLVNKWLTHDEILEIFSDVCEAVARLHHSKTPVIHRDLKVENILIDRRTGTERPIYVLCDFGSATTKVLAKDHYTHAFMEEEIQRYTTLSYRAPEMIDLFSGVPIDTKSDIWALGILLYKLCYFSLPFGESALAIQSGLFTFPEVPQIPDSIKAIINLMLTLSAKHRPNIFQTSYLTFAATNKKCPVYNIEKSARIELNEAIQILHFRDKLGSNYSRLFEKAINDFEAQKRRHTIPTDNQLSTNVHSNEKNTGSTTIATENQTDNEKFPTEGVIVSTTRENIEMHPRLATTSVNPRLRPKPQNIPSTAIAKQYRIAEIAETNINSTGTAKPQLDTPNKITHQSTALRVGQNAKISHQPTEPNPNKVEGSTDVDGLPHLSAFQPYSLAKEKRVYTIYGERGELIVESSNPFVQPSTSITDMNMDDNLFGEHFDAMRKIHYHEGDQNLNAFDSVDGVSIKANVTHEYRNMEESKTNLMVQYSPRIERDWMAIEEEMGDDPFKNAPAILSYQYFKH